MARWDPLREITRMEEEIRRMFDRLWDERSRWEFLPAPTRGRLAVEKEEGLVGTPAVDLVDKGNRLVLRSEMPGVTKNDIKVSVTEDSITISGKVEKKEEEKKEDYYFCERAYSSWRRTLPLPVKVKPDGAKAKYENGVLEVVLPKAEETKKKEVKVE